MLLSYLSAEGEPVRSDPPEYHVDYTSVIMQQSPTAVHQKSESVPMQDNPAYESVIIDRSDSVTMQQNPAYECVACYKEETTVQRVVKN